MPVSISERGGKFCVVEPDGGVVKCHPEKRDALAHMRAINANVDKAVETSARNLLEGKIHQSFTIAADELVIRGYISREQRIELSGIIGNVLGEFGEMAETVLGETTVDVTDVEQIANKDVAYVEQPEDIEKSIPEVVMLQSVPTTFDEMDSARAKHESTTKVRAIIEDFKFLISNIFSLGTGNEVSEVRQLAKQMADRLEDEEEELEDEEKEIEIEEKMETDPVGSQVMIWKQDDGSWRWFGIFSNKFRDNDKPSEILSEKAHVEFIDRVEKGEVDYPELYVWHIPVSVGKTDLMAYEESGFAIVTGLFTNEGVAMALSKSDADLAMSHGMPVAHIKRDKDDPTIIVSYISEEVSVLPRDVAANKMTDFVVLKEDESMAIIPKEKRSQVVDLLGDDLTAELENSLISRGKSAEQAGVEFKEGEDIETSPAEEATLVTEEGTEIVAEVEVVEEVTIEAEVDIEVEAEETETDYVSKGEMTEALVTIARVLSGGLDAINGRLDQIEKSVDEVQKEDDEKLDERIATTSSASLAAKIAEGLVAKDAGTVIGTKAAHLHGNNKLAKDGPEQTEPEEAGEFNGLFFQQWYSQ